LLIRVESFEPLKGEMGVGDVACGETATGAHGPAGKQRCPLQLPVTSAPQFHSNDANAPQLKSPHGFVARSERSSFADKRIISPALTLTTLTFTASSSPAVQQSSSRSHIAVTSLFPY